jgi:hypothetical protein
MRDSQRSKVYAAEELLGDYFTADRVEQIPDILAYCQSILASEWFRHRFPGFIHIAVHDGGGRRSACAWAMGSTIRMPRFSRSKMCILHELAHLCADHQYRRKVPTDPWQPIAAHGWEFCAIFLELVRQYLGQPRHDQLVAAFRAKRVQFTPKITRSRVLVGA